MKAIVTGGSGKIGRSLVEALRAKGYEVFAPSHDAFDLKALPDTLPASFDGADVVYLCAAKTRFIDCEADFECYSVNVDAQIELGKKLKFSGAALVYLSSEAVEKALHTNYGNQKALAEIGLRAVADPIIARLCSVNKANEQAVCAWLVSLARKRPGIYRWQDRDAIAPAQKPAFEKHGDCCASGHGCRLVSGGLVCQGSCQWLENHKRWDAAAVEREAA